MADCTKEFNQLLAKIDLSKTKIENLKRGGTLCVKKSKTITKTMIKPCPIFADKVPLK